VPCPCPCPCPCPSPLPHPPVRPFSILRRPLLFPRDPRRGADRPDRPDCRDVFCIELTKCTSRIFIAPTNIAGRGRVTDARLHFGKNTRKNTGKGNPPLLAARNPDEGPRRFLPPPPPPLPPQRTVVYRVLSVWIPEWIPQYVNLYVSLCPYYRYDILCEDKLLRKYITDITPKR